MTNTLTELSGRPGAGKTWAAHNGWPHPLHLDTAITQIKARDHEIGQVDADRGESWEVVLQQYGWDADAAGENYRYIERFDQILDVIAEDDNEHESVIIDNTYDLKALAIKKFLEDKDQGWIRREEYGWVNDAIDELTQRLLSMGYHVVWITQMKDEYRNGDRTGGYVEDGPKRADHRCEFRIRMEVDDDGRHAWVKKNRFMDPASGEYGAQGSDVGPEFDLEELLLVSEIPEGEW